MIPLGASFPVIPIAFSYIIALQTERTYSKRMVIAIWTDTNLNPLNELEFCYAADRFEGVEWTAATNGSPILIKALAYMECEVKSRLEVADHWIVYAEVTDGNVSNPDGKTAAHHRKIGNYY